MCMAKARYIVGEKIWARVAGGQGRGTYRTRAVHVRRQGLDVCGGKGRLFVGAVAGHVRGQG